MLSNKKTQLNPQYSRANYSTENAKKSNISYFLYIQGKMYWIYISGHLILSINKRTWYIQLQNKCFSITISSQPFSKYQLRDTYNVILDKNVLKYKRNNHKLVPQAHLFAQKCLEKQPF
jgi:hypothetical protein